MGCGDNRSGQLGLGAPKTLEKNVAVPIMRDFEGKITKVACGAEFSMILNEHGQLFAFGHPDFGCLGNGEDGKYFISASKLSYRFEYAPIKVSGYLDKDPDAVEKDRDNKLDFLPLLDVSIIDVKCGPLHTIALASDG